MGKEYVQLLPILIDSLETVYNRPRFGFHVSDVLICILESYFKNKSPVPLSMKQLNFFTSGRAVHASYEELFTQYPDRFDEHEVWLSRKTRKIHHVTDEEGLIIIMERKMLQTEQRNLIRLFNKTKHPAYGQRLENIEKALKNNDAFYKAYLVKNGIDPMNDIVAHIDLYDEKNNQPYEAKTSRTAGLKEPKGFHIKQLHYYMALTGAEWGGVFYQYLINFEDKPFEEFKFTLTEAERQQKLDELIKAVDTYAYALEANRPDLAPNVLNNPEFNDWKCWKAEWKTKTVNGEKKKYKTGVTTPECPWYKECLEINAAKGRDAGLSPDLLAKYSP